MPSTPQARPYWSSGRGFASSDPERQSEVLGYVRRSPIETVTTARPAAAPARADSQRWMSVQPDVDSSGFEGSSSGRSR